MIRLTAMLRALREHWPVAERASGPDPFETLAVQHRLACVAAEIRALERDTCRWARGHHLTAATGAYDQLLCQAARMTGVPVPDADPVVRRLMLEVQLRDQGWSW